MKNIPVPDRHLTRNELEAYVGRRTGADELLATSDHLANCASCRALLTEFAEELRTTPADDGDDELRYEQLAAAVENDRDPLTRREVERNLANSPAARRELADLARFRDQMNALPPRRFDIEATSPPSGSGSFFRWALPLAAVISLGVGGLWWSITLRQMAEPLVRLRDGNNELVLGPNGRSRALRDLPAALQDAIADAYRTRTLALAPDIRELAGREQVLAGPGDDRRRLRVLAPVATAVRDGMPKFVWSALPEASAYRINIVEEASGKVIASEQLPPDQTEWTPAQPLRAGERYEWEVQAIGATGVLAKSPAPPEPEARFQVISEAKRLELEAEERLARGSHLVMGVANARAGLVNEALREFRKLSEENPNAEFPRQLLEQLQKQQAPKR